MASVQTVTNTRTVSLGTDGSASHVVQCPAGTVRVGGGGSVSGTTDVAMTASEPIPAAGWQVTAQRHPGLTFGSRDITITVRAVCAAGP